MSDLHKFHDALAGSLDKRARRAQEKEEDAVSDIVEVAERTRKAREAEDDRAKARGDYDPHIERDGELGLVVALPVRGLVGGSWMWPEAAGDLGRKLVRLEEMIAVEQIRVRELAKELPEENRSEFIETTMDLRLGLSAESITENERRTEWQ